MDTTQPSPPADPPAHPADRRGSRLAGAALLLALFAAAMWFAWLGWDHEYYVVDGVAQGPYRAWQVVGCGVSIVLGAVLAYLWVRRPVAVLVLAFAGTVGVAVPWAVDAATHDDSGLWVIGLMLLLVGAGVGLSAVLGVTAAVVGLRTPRR